MPQPPASSSSAHRPLNPVRAAGLTRAFLRLRTVARRRQHHIRFSTVINVLGQDGLLALNALLALLNIVLSPLQGISLPLGFLQMMVTTAVLRKRNTFWSPRRWQSYAFKSNSLMKHLDRWIPYLYTLETISHPRGRRIMRRKNIYTATVWLLLFLAFVITLPIPFMNITPALAVFFLSLGLINHDIVMWIIGLIVVAAHSLLYVFWSAFYPHAVAAFHAFIPSF